jgi:hypothetical protein
LTPDPISPKITKNITTRSQPRKMGSSAEHCISTTGLSFLKNQRGVLKLLIFFVLTFSCLSLVVAAPTDSEVVSLPNDEKGEAITTDQGGLSHFHNTVLLGKSEDILVPNLDLDLRKREAGLAWGPVYIGNLKLYLTNPHDGYAGPKFPNANHINFHVDKQAPKNSYTAVVNLHIVKYTSDGRFCLYAWDSVTKKTVFDNCFDNIVSAIAECVDAAKNFVDDLLRAADFIAAIFIIAALVVALTTALAGLGAVALA